MCCCAHALARVGDTAPVRHVRVPSPDILPFVDVAYVQYTYLPLATASMQGLASHSIALLLGRGTPLAHIDDIYSLQRVSCLLIARSIYRPTLRSLYWSIESHTGYGIILPPDMQMG